MLQARASALRHVRHCLNHIGGEVRRREVPVGRDGSDRQTKLALACASLDLGAGYGRRGPYLYGLHADLGTVPSHVRLPTRHQVHGRA
jgi:hypothetical protein